MSAHIVIDARIRTASTGRYVDRLVEHLERIDKTNRYTVLVRPGDNWRPKAGNFSREDAPFAQFSFNPLQQIGFTRLIKKLKPDLVHFPMNQQPILYRGKIVTSTMDLTMLRFTRPGKTPLPVFWLKMAGYRFLFRNSIRKSNAIITISKFVKKDLEAHYPVAKHKTTVTYCAAEPEISDSAKQPQGVDRPFILHVGSPFPHKNVERLVDAFDLLKKDHPKLQLVLAGKKEQYFNKLEAYAQKSPAKDSIIFPGFVSDAELKWLYQSAEAYVLPSLSEGFGLPGLEAMAHGCPVISSNATCLPEIYGDGVLYFNPHDTEDMAEKIHDVLSDKSLRQTLIKNGYKRITKYSWNKMAEQTLEIYYETLKKSR